ncbi:MAG: hypothetical protein WA194_06685 [Patescibacteria group bacterium]
MSDNVVQFPGLTDVERDLVDLELATPASLLKAREIRDRAGEVVGFDYLSALLNRLSRGKPVLPEGFDPATDPLPHQYAYHFEMLDLHDLDFFRRLADVAFHDDDEVPVRLKADLFHLRSEAIRRIAEIEASTGRKVVRRKKSG